MDIQPYLVPLFTTAGIAAAGAAAINVVHRSAAAPPPTGDDEVGLNLVALGYPGAGKTALLASMFHTLFRNEGRGVTVQTDPAHQEQFAQLRELARSFEDINMALPYHTAKQAVYEYNFVFDVRPLADPHHAQPLRFRYVDYSGEHLRERDRTHQLMPRLAAALDEADVVLGVVDGASIAAMMRSGRDDDALTELQNLFRLLENHQQKVIQIVLTKWDLLVAEKHSLEEVISWLEQRVVIFRNFRRAGRNSPVRVIPTSAFGLNGFIAEPKPKGVSRDSSRAWEPFMTGLPVACAVNEVLDHGIHRLTGPAGAPTAFTATSVSPFFAWAVEVLGLVTVSTDLSGNLQFSLNPNALDRYRGMISGTAKPTGDVPADSEALQQVLRECRNMTEVLDHEFHQALPG